ncbi:MAG TPA: serpin family protein, partial [Chloroflexota bacterium]
MTSSRLSLGILSCLSRFCFALAFERRVWLALACAPLACRAVHPAPAHDDAGVLGVGDAAKDVVVVAAPPPGSLAAPAPPPRPVRDPAREHRAAESCNGFAYTMYGNAAPRDDFLFSPPSLAFALAMTAAGARGETRAELARALHSDDPEQVAGDYGALLAALSARLSETGAELDLASSIWVQQGISCRPEFLDLLGTRFGAATGEADFAGSLASARVAINGWAFEQTHGRIVDLLAEHDIDPLTRLVIASAAYLKDTWVRPFDPSVTRDEPFATPGGR